MKIVVAYKWAANSQDAVVTADGDVDFSRAKAGLSEYDAVAFQLGRDLAAATGSELVGVTVGGKEVAAPLAAKAVLSRGVDRLVAIADPETQKAGTTRTAQLLASLIKGIDDVGLVLAGDCSVDVGARMVPAVLGGVLGWPTFTDATAVAAEEGALVVERRLAGGTQTLRVSGPAVLAVASDAVKPNAPSMKEIIAAGKKPVQTAALAGVSADLASDGMVVEKSRSVAAERKGITLPVDDVAAAVSQLVNELNDLGLVDAEDDR